MPPFPPGSNSYKTSLVARDSDETNGCRSSSGSCCASNCSIDEVDCLLVMGCFAQSGTYSKIFRSHSGKLFLFIEFFCMLFFFVCERDNAINRLARDLATMYVFDNGNASPPLFKLVQW
ncbi:hypothetical protein ACP275_02G111000 [Erythranthe tilingii]